MPIRFQCVHCSARMRVPDGSEGRRVRCPRCGHTQHVPEESLPPLPAFPSADDSVAGTMAMSEAVPSAPVAPAPAEERPEASPVSPPQAVPPSVEPESVVAPPSDVSTVPAASWITEDAERRLDDTPHPPAAMEGVPPSMTEPVRPPLQPPPQSVGPGDFPAGESKSASEPPPERGGVPSLASAEPELSVGPVVAAAGGHLAAPVVGEALAIVAASVAGRAHPTPMPHVEPRPRDAGALPPSGPATPGATPHAIPLSSHPSVYRPPPRPMPQGVDASLPMVAPAPPPLYLMLMLAGWMLRSLAVLAVVVSAVSVFMAVRHMGMARPMAMLLFMGGLSMGVLLLAAGEAVIAFRDMVRNSYRR